MFPLAFQSKKNMHFWLLSFISFSNDFFSLYARINKFSVTFKNRTSWNRNRCLTLVSQSSHVFDNSESDQFPTVRLCESRDKTDLSQNNIYRSIFWHIGMKGTSESIQPHQRTWLSRVNVINDFHRIRHDWMIGEWVNVGKWTREREGYKNSMNTCLY